MERKFGFFLITDTEKDIIISQLELLNKWINEDLDLYPDVDVTDISFVPMSNEAREILKSDDVDDYIQQSVLNINAEDTYSVIKDIKSKYRKSWIIITENHMLSLIKGFEDNTSQVLNNNKFIVLCEEHVPHPLIYSRGFKKIVFIPSI